MATEVEAQHVSTWSPRKQCFILWEEPEEGRGGTGSIVRKPAFSLALLPWSLPPEADLVNSGRRKEVHLPSSILFFSSGCLASKSNILLEKEYMLFGTYPKGTAEILSLILLCWC